MKLVNVKNGMGEEEWINPERVYLVRTVKDGIHAGRAMLIFDSGYQLVVTDMNVTSVLRCLTDGNYQYGGAK